jgi:glycosyltransferase involved in cell wall biosynthesis
MYVCHLTGSIDPSAGGPAYSIPRLCESLVDLGQRIELLTLKGSEDHLVKTPHRAFKLGWGPTKLGHSSDMWHWLREDAQTEAPDIYHSHNLWIMPSIYPALMRAFEKIPHIVSPRGTLTQFSLNSGSRFKKVHWPLVQAPTLQRVLGFHATAESELLDIRRAGFRQPVAVIPNGIDLPISWTETESESNVVLYFGRIHPEKGLSNLLFAWASVQPAQKNWTLQIVGPDPVGYLSELRRIVAEKCIHAVEFHPSRYGESKYDFYKRAAIYILPSPSENFGLTVAEALSAGVPAIATTGSPWQGLIIEKCGWWVDPRAEDLAAALLSAMVLPCGTLREMGRRGRLWMEKTATWPKLAQDMLDFYGYLLGRNDRPACVDLVRK